MNPGEAVATKQSGEMLRGMLENLSYEVTPFEATEESVRTHVPKTIRITVTASPARGIEATTSGIFSDTPGLCSWRSAGLP